MAPLICEGLRVLDLSISMSGALPTMIMSDAGAEVIKIEPPEGDPTRKHYAHPMWHRGKKSVVLDLKTREGQGHLHDLARHSDVLLTTFRPGVAERLGAGYETIKEVNPSLVYTAISGFGPVDEYKEIKAYDGIVAALSGRVHTFDPQTDKDGPIFSALPVASFGAGMYALQGTMAALYVRERTGRGQKVETSLLQALGAYDWMSLTWQLRQRGEDPFKGLPMEEPSPQYFVAPTKDGKWIQMANAMDHLFINWLVGIGLGGLLDDPRFIELPQVVTGEANEELYRLMFSRMAEKTLDEWMHLFMTEVDTASEPFLHTQQGLSHPQVLHNGSTVRLYDDRVGETLQLGPVAKFTETPLQPHGPAPSLGQHTAEVIAQSRNGHGSSSRSGNGRMPGAPLEGVTLVEFASWFAVPFAPAILADLGARVIKVEPTGGDPWRGFGPMGYRTLQGKEAVAIDLRTEKGQEIGAELMAEADLIVHNLRPGVPQKLGIDYESAKQVNPSVIYLYGGGYGSTGPYSHRPAMHPVPGAVCGGAMYQAGRGMPPPPDADLSYEEVRKVARWLGAANEGNPDVSSSMVNASTLLMALYAREKTGLGQYIETSMLCSNLYANSDDALQYEGKPERLLPDPDLNGLHALYRFYKAKDEWVFLACTTDVEWEHLCTAIDRGALATDPRFLTESNRLDHELELADLLEPIFAQRTAGEWQEYLTRRNVACVEVFPADICEFANTSPLMWKYGLSVEREHPSFGKFMRYGRVVDFSKTSATTFGPFTFIGEHTGPVLKELGYTDDHVRELEEQKIVVCHR